MRAVLPLLALAGCAATDRPGAPVWRFQASAAGAVASYGGTADAPGFAVRCDPQARRLVFSRPGAAGTMTLRTGDAVLALPASAGEAALASADPFAVGALAYPGATLRIAADGAPAIEIATGPDLLAVVRTCPRG